MRNYVVTAGLLASSCLLAMQAHGVERTGAVKDDTGDVKSVRKRLVVRKTH